MNKEALTPQETEKEKIILGITSFVQENRKDYAEEIYRLWIEPFIDASQPSLPLDWEKEFREYPDKFRLTHAYWPTTNDLIDYIKTHLLSKVSYGSGMSEEEASEPITTALYNSGIHDTEGCSQLAENILKVIGDYGYKIVKAKPSATLSDEDIERMAEDDNMNISTKTIKNTVMVIDPKQKAEDLFMTFFTRIPDDFSKEAAIEQALFQSSTVLIEVEQALLRGKAQMLELEYYNNVKVELSNLDARLQSKDLSDAGFKAAQHLK